MSELSDLQLSALGDRALLLRFPGERIDITLNQRVHALAARLRCWPEFVEVVPAYASIAVYLAPGVWPDAALQERLRAWLTGPDVSGASALEAPLIELPVRFDGADLDTVAQAHSLDSTALIRRLCARTYQVAMLGFLPGFPYLLGLDPALALPRRAQPRLHVPANSLALGGAQLGIYPCGSPGGWHLLGTLAVRLFDPERDRPALLAPGDRLRFVAMGEGR